MWWKKSSVISSIFYVKIQKFVVKSGLITTKFAVKSGLITTKFVVKNGLITTKFAAKRGFTIINKC